jgi:excisionase family DNA binding protein
MYKVSDFDKQFYRVHEVAVILGLSDKTIREYDKAGVLKAERTEGNQRHFSKNEIIKYLDERNLLIHDEEENRRDVIYVRVSTIEQAKQGDLDRQALFIIENIEDLKNPLILKEIGNGLDDTRPKLVELLSKVSNNEIRNVYIANKDKLTRFGFEYLKTFFNLHGTQIITVKNNIIKKTQEEELIDEMFALMENFVNNFYSPEIINIENEFDIFFDKIKDYINNL